MAILDLLFRLLKESKGSDLHLVAGQPPKIRIHGQIITVKDHEVFTSDSLQECLLELGDIHGCLRLGG